MAERAARRADGDVPQCTRRRAAVGVGGNQQVLAHALAVGGARFAPAHEVRAGTEHEALGRLGAQAELSRDLLMREAVELAADERVPLLLRQRREVVEQLAHTGTAGGRALGLARGGRCDHHGCDLVVERDRVHAHAAELVERTVAREPEQPRLQVHRAVVAHERAAGAQHRLLHDVLGDARRRARQDPPREALEAVAVAQVDQGERVTISGAVRRDERLVGCAGADGCHQRHRLLLRIQPRSSLAVSMRDQRRSALRRRTRTRSPR